MVICNETETSGSITVHFQTRRNPEDYDVLVIVLVLAILNSLSIYFYTTLLHYFKQWNTVFPFIRYTKHSPGLKVNHFSHCDLYFIVVFRQKSVSLARGSGVSTNHYWHAELELLVGQPRHLTCKSAVNFTYYSTLLPFIKSLGICLDWMTGSVLNSVYPKRKRALRYHIVNSNKPNVNIYKFKRVPWFGCSSV